MYPKVTKWMSKRVAMRNRKCISLSGHKTYFWSQAISRSLPAYLGIRP